MTLLAALSLIAVILVSSPAVNSRAASLTWPTFHQNPQHTGLSSFAGPSSPLLKWRFSTAGSILSSPAIAFGTIYVGSDDGNLYALSRNGHLKWKFTTGGPIESSPSVARDGTVYVGSFDNYLYAVRPNGQLKWKLNIGQVGPGSPTIGPDGTIYVGGSTVEGAYALFAVRPNGTVKWRSLANAEIYDSPAIGIDGTIYLAIDDPAPTGQCAECLEAVYPNGTVRWGARGGVGNAENTSPTVGADGTIYMGGFGNIFFALRPDGTIEWKIVGNLDETLGSTAAIGQSGTIFLTSSQTSCHPYPPGCSAGGDSTTRLYALASNGSILWQFSITNGISGSQIFCCIYGTVSSPAIDANGVVYFGAVDGGLYAVSPNGSLLWKSVLGGAIGSSPAIDIDRAIYVGSTDGNLYAIGDNGNNNQDDNVGNP